MAEARTLEAPEKRQFGVRAPRRKGPLEEVPGKNLVKEAKRRMDEALKSRNTDPYKAGLAAERAFGLYLVASRRNLSEKGRDDCLFKAGEALSLAASLCEESDPRRAGRLHLEAGDYFHAGAWHGTKPKDEVLRLAREQYVLALELGGVVRVLQRKIAMCDRAIGE
jgi:hypothetical protein